MSSAASLLLLASLGLDIGQVLGAGGGGGRVTLLVGGAVQREGAECQTGQTYVLQYRGYYSTTVDSTGGTLLEVLGVEVEVVGGLKA